MFAIRKDNIIKLYDISIDYEKLKNLNEKIKDNCSIIVEKKLIMDTNISYDPDFIIKFSTIRDSKYKDETFYDNICQINLYPKIVKLIDKLVETKDIKLICKIYSSLNEDVEDKLKINDLLGVYIKLLKKINNPVYQNVKDLVNYKYNEKLIKGSNCRLIFYKSELDECFEIKKYIVDASDDKIYSTMEDLRLYVLDNKNGSLAFTQISKNNKVLIKTLSKCK